MPRAIQRNETEANRSTIMAIQERMNDFEILDASSCNTCANRISPSRCLAFNEIPMGFILGDNNHTNPFEGDGGIRYIPSNVKEKL